MIVPPHSSSVPLFHALGNGTAEQDQELRNTEWNTAGTFSLKALVNKVLERNRKGNKPGTTALKSVPPTPQIFSACGTNSQGGYKGLDDLLYEFNERAAILEYDGGLTREEAERLARIDAEANQKNAAP